MSHTMTRTRRRPVTWRARVSSALRSDPSAVTAPAVGRTLRQRAEAGMTTVEYAIGTIAAAAFAGLLIVVIKSGPVKAMLVKVINAALGSGL